jgi:hypothetical protein
VVGYASRTGMFATCVGCALPGIGTLTPSYAATLLRLTVQ